MKLIKNLLMEKKKNYYQSVSLFLCPYCCEIVKKQTSNGKRDKSCGCQKNKLSSKSKIKHGDCLNNKLSRLYSVWCNLKQRCYNKNNKDYKNYGDRSITIYEQWDKSYVVFKEWALNNGYKENLEIDRINNNGDYCPENCRWVTATKQNKNKRNNKLTLKKANQIRSLYFNTKISQMLLSKIFKVYPSQIHYIVHNKQWIEYNEN